MPETIPDIPPHIELRRLRAFAALVTYGSAQDAATALGMTKEGIAKPVRELTKAFGDRPLTEPRDGRLIPTALGDELYRVAIDILHRVEGLSTLEREVKPHTTVAYLPHHAEFIAPMLVAAKANSSFVVQAEVLGEQHRSVNVFQQTVIGGLSGGTYDVVIGPEPHPERAANLYSARLYTSSMVALVGAAEPDTLTFAEAAERQLLLPPPETRAGLAIRGALAAALPEGTDIATRIEQSAHGTKVLVIHGSVGLGTVIVPSDISFAFGPQGTLHGEPLRAMKWVPVHDATGEELRHTVHVTVRQRARLEPGVAEVVRLISKHVRKRMRSPFIELHPLVEWRPRQ